MSLDERLLSGHGFAVFSRDPVFAARAVGRYVALDPEVRHVVLIHHPSTSPALLESMQAVTSSFDVRTVAWASYGHPSNVSAIAALPSKHLVFVSLDHHRSVHDRLDRRRAHIRRKDARKKIAVDAIPYEALPWRVYFPFAFFDTGLLGYHHSYAIEQDYERFLDGALATNPCEVNAIVDRTWRHAVVDASARFAALPTVRVLAASPVEHKAYAIQRDRLFESEKTIASVKKKLSDWIQARHPERSIPLDVKRIYEPGISEIVRTDLPFDRWLAEELLGVMEHTNALVARYIQHQREAGE